MKPDICIYHGNCADGFTAAWAVWKAFPDCHFHPGVYGEAPPDVPDKNVVMVDFSYKRPVIEAMSAAARTLVILDHHKTAQADLSGWPPPLDGPYNPSAMTDWQRECNSPNATHCLFDMERSGAQIAWDYFHAGKPRPAMVDYVGDRDLWKFALPGSREVAATIFSHPYDFKTWDWLVNRADFPMALQEMIAEGAAIERKHHKDIAELLKITRRQMRIGGVDVPVANLPYTMSSDAAGMMAADAPFAACYFDRGDARVFSLRSRGLGGADVSQIAAGYGGGGHKNAAGFQAEIGWEGDPV